jgi:hypothetical protein
MFWFGFQSQWLISFTLGGSSAGSTSTLDEFEHVESGDVPKNGEDAKVAKKSKKRVT